MHLSPIYGYRMTHIPYYYNAPAAYSSYGYYPPYGYAPYEPPYPTIVESPPTPVFRTPTNKPSGSLPPAPKGRAPPEPTNVNSSLSFAYAPPIAYNPVQYTQPAPPQPQYYYPYSPPSAYYSPPYSSYYYDQYRSSPPYYHHDRYELPPYVRFPFCHRSNEKCVTFCFVVLLNE